MLVLRKTFTIMDTVFTESSDTERASLVSNAFTLQFVFTTMQEVLSAVKAGSVFLGRICTIVRTPLRVHLSLSNCLIRLHLQLV